MAKKDSGKETERNGVGVAAKSRKKRAKGNFAIFTKEAINEEGGDTHFLWREVVAGLDAATACEKYIKEHVEEFRDKTIMFVQVKKIGEIKVETKVKVSF